MFTTPLPHTGSLGSLPPPIGRGPTRCEWMPAQPLEVAPIEGDVRRGGVYSSYQADLVTRMPKKELQAGGAARLLLLPDPKAALGRSGGDGEDVSRLVGLGCRPAFSRVGALFINVSSCRWRRPSGHKPRA